MRGVRLLVVDDEPSLLDLLQRYLGRLGYEVDVAETAEDALTKFESNPDEYALVFTDLSLPGMGGEELLERMRVLRPALPALVSSGYPFEPRTTATGFLLKPYVPAMLAKELERLLQRKAGA